MAIICGAIRRRHFGVSGAGADLLRRPAYKAYVYMYVCIYIYIYIHIYIYIYIWWFVICRMFVLCCPVYQLVARIPRSWNRGFATEVQTPNCWVYALLVLVCRMVVHGTPSRAPTLARGQLLRGDNIYIYIYIHTYICIYIYIYIHVYVYIYMYIYIYN